MNKFIGIGRNTKEGELRQSESGISIYNNSLAMTNNFKNKEGNYDSEFINYVAYRNTAEFLNKYSTKGTMIMIEGRIHTRSYDAQDGTKRYVTEVIVENAQVLEKKQQVESEESEVEDKPKEVSLSDEDIDKVFNGEDLDLPF